jgi:hypothetical protein
MSLTVKEAKAPCRSIELRTDVEHVLDVDPVAGVGSGGDPEGTG